MRRTVAWLWKNRREWMLRQKGFENNTLSHSAEFLDLFIEVCSSDTALLSIREMYNLYWAVKSVSSVAGDLAAVGVNKGGSAKIICAAEGDKTLHLFDTFEGMPVADPSIDYHRKGDFSDTSIISIRKYLAEYNGVEFHQGVFPESALNLPPEIRFSFVNLDVDLFKSTLDGLEYFYPRMSQGGILISHDYRSISCPGVRKAFQEFLVDKKETLIELWDTQCLFLKL